MSTETDSKITVKIGSEYIVQTERNVHVPCIDPNMQYLYLMRGKRPRFMRGTGSNAPISLDQLNVLKIKKPFHLDSESSYYNDLENNLNRIFNLNYSGLKIKFVSSKSNDFNLELKWFDDESNLESSLFEGRYRDGVVSVYRPTEHSIPIILAHEILHSFDGIEHNYHCNCLMNNNSVEGHVSLTIYDLNSLSTNPSNPPSANPYLPKFPSAYERY